MRFFDTITIAVLFLFCGCCHCQNSGDCGTWKHTDGSNGLALYASSGSHIGTVKMARNTKYCRPVDGGRAVEYAPVVLPPSTSAPTEWEYNDAGWYRNEIKPPVVPEGKMVASVAYRYCELDHSVAADYTFEDAPKPIRVFSKLLLEDALFSRGVMDIVDAFIDSQTVTNKFGQTMPLRRKYSTALDFREDHPLFRPAVDKLKELLGWDDAQVEEVLAASVKEGY